MPFIPPVSPGEGLDIGVGMCMCVFCSGDPCGFGEAVGICIPGMFACVCGDAEGEACGICIPGMFACVCGDDEGEACGICIPGMFGCVCGDGCAAGIPVCLGDDELWDFRIFMPCMLIPGMLPIRCFFVDRLFLGTALRFLAVALRVDFALGFGIFMPGMFCMSWSWANVLLFHKSIRPETISAPIPVIKIRAPKPNVFMVSPLNFLRSTNACEDAHPRRHTSAHWFATTLKGKTKFERR